MDEIQAIRAHAARVLGGSAAAEQWLNSPAVALNQQRPIDVLAEDPQLVMTLLTRMEHGVYT